jgi:hypothetical protein
MAHKQHVFFAGAAQSSPATCLSSAFSMAGHSSSLTPNVSIWLEWCACELNLDSNALIVFTSILCFFQVSVGVITEIILENTSIIVSPFLLYRMYDQPIFMSIVSLWDAEWN